jgi:bifunctional UDP-N-acetylglucosamine pyrophosphorylase / glucosamine-1-phosphate N-acetyltransferase
MRSLTPKVLHPVAGRPMLEHVLDLAGQLDSAATVVVVAPDQPAVRRVCAAVEVAEQREQRGTGHAVLQARELLRRRCETVLVLYGDTPLFRLESARALVGATARASVAILTAELDDPSGYGRIVRDRAGRVLMITEEAEADAATLALREVNSGLLAFEAEWLWERLPLLPVRSKGELYLTDLVEQALREGRPVAAVKTDDPREIMGINSQGQLAQANRRAWDQTTERLMANGVTVLDPATTYIEDTVEVAAGATILPNTHLQGATRIGAGCRIGPNSIVIDSVIGPDSRVWASVVEGSELEGEVEMGPFAHLRPGCLVERGVKLGNFSEAKASRIGRDTQVHHFSYLGDSDVGAGVNIGAGTITCNYDGELKHRTVIEDGAFVGSDSMLIAPVRIGARAVTGAGSVVTRDVAADSMVVGVPARRVQRGSPAKRGTAEPRDGE